MTASLRVPRPASSPPPSWWRAFVRRPSGRPASAKQPSATAPLRSSLHYARRPRSRLGNPVRLRRSGGEHRFRQPSSPQVQARRFAVTFPVLPPSAVIHARRTRQLKCFCRLFGVNRFGFVPCRSGSRLVVLITPKLQQEAATATEKSVTVAARSAPRQFLSNSSPSHQR